MSTGSQPDPPQGNELDLNDLINRAQQWSAAGLQQATGCESDQPSPLSVALTRLVCAPFRPRPVLLEPKALHRLLAPSTPGAPDIAAPNPELAPQVYTSAELGRQLNYKDSTIRRKGAIALKRGPAPQPLPGLPDWYVVEQGHRKGGRRCGWKFKRLHNSEAT